MVDYETQELRDYKIFCFNGVPKFIQVDIGRFSNHCRNIYTTDWELLPVTFKCKNSIEMSIKAPKCLVEMLELAKKLSEGLVHVRVDFYDVNGQVYFGELTFHHGGGAEVIEPKEYDKLWGSFLNLQ